MFSRPQSSRHSEASLPPYLSFRGGHRPEYFRGISTIGVLLFLRRFLVNSSPLGTRNDRTCWVVLCSLFILLSSCSHQTEVDDIMQKEKVFPTEQGTDTEILYTDSGLVRIRVTAPVMNHFTLNVPEPYTEMPQGIYVEFYNEESKIKTTLKADYGIRYEKSKRTEVKKNVVVVNVAGETLNTDKLNWDEATRKIYTDAFVKITTKKEVLQGTGMEANEDFTEYEIRNISGTATAPGEEGK